jgi:hypothetical protein
MKCAKSVLTVIATVALWAYASQAQAQVTKPIGAYQAKFLGIKNGMAQWSCTLVYGVPGGGLATGTFGASFQRSLTTGNYPTQQQVYAYFYWDAWYQTIYFTYLNPAANAYAANPNPTTLAAYVAALQKMSTYQNTHPVPKY